MCAWATALPHGVPGENQFRASVMVQYANPPPCCTNIPAVLVRAASLPMQLHLWSKKLAEDSLGSWDPASTWGTLNKNLPPGLRQAQL